jgi:hypothetical protein
VVSVEGFGSGIGYTVAVEVEIGKNYAARGCCTRNWVAMRMVGVAVVAEERYMVAVSHMAM